MYSYYGALSTEVYNIDKPIGHSFGDIEYYKDRLQSCNGKILEPATGTGRMLIPLLQSGFDVHGMDSSEEMLALCKDNCQRYGVTTTLFKGLMESFKTSERYEAIIIPTGSYLLMDNWEDAVKALENFYYHLELGGRLIIDLIYPSRLDVGVFHHRSWDTSNNEKITLEERLLEVDFINQRTTSLMRYEKWKDTKLIQTELEQFPLKWYGISEFKRLLKDTGFHEITVSADYICEKEPVKTSSIITFEAVKKESTGDLMMTRLEQD